MSNATTPTSAPLPLADLHLPPEPSIFPFAWGWWLVIGACLLSLCFCIYLLCKKIKRNRARKMALKALNDCQSIAQINHLLKRAALSYFPREEVASLTTGAWLSFLDQQLSSNEQGFLKMESQWINASFSANEGHCQTVVQAKALAYLWLKKGLPPKEKKRKEEQQAHV